MIVAVWVADGKASDEQWAVLINDEGTHGGSDDGRVGDRSHVHWNRECGRCGLRVGGGCGARHDVEREPQLAVPVSGRDVLCGSQGEGQRGSIAS